MDIFSIFFNMKVCCVFSLESPHRGDSNEYTQYTIFNIEKENHPKIISNLQLWIFVPNDSRTSSNSPGKRAISVRATEVLVYLFIFIVSDHRSARLFMQFIVKFFWKFPVVVTHYLLPTHLHPFGVQVIKIV